MKYVGNDDFLIDNKTQPSVPGYVVESFARCLLPTIREYFDSEEGQREFAEWKEGKEKGDLEKSYGK